MVLASRVIASRSDRDALYHQFQQGAPEKAVRMVKLKFLLRWRDKNIPRTRVILSKSALLRICLEGSGGKERVEKPARG